MRFPASFVCICSQNKPETNISFSSACTAHAWFAFCCGQEFNKVWNVGVWGCQTPWETWSKTNPFFLLCRGVGRFATAIIASSLVGGTGFSSEWCLYRITLRHGDTAERTERNTVPVVTISSSEVCGYPAIVQTNQTALKLEYKWIQMNAMPAWPRFQLRTRKQNLDPLQHKRICGRFDGN